MIALIKRVVLIAVAAAVCYWLAERFGFVTAALVWAGLTAVGCATGAVLLRTSAIGRVTWRNHTAGYLIPWGWRLNKGRLRPVAVISWCVWMLIGAAAVLLLPTGEAPGFGVRAGLFAAWIIDAAALLYLLGTIRQATPGSRVGSLWKLSLAAFAVIGVSVGLSLSGMPEAALVVGGGPPTVALGCVGLVMLIFVTVGRNTRWN